MATPSNKEVMHTIAERYAKEIIESKNLKSTLDKITREINSIKYSSGKYINQNDINEIIELIEYYLKLDSGLENLEESTTLAKSNKTHFILNQTDTSEFNQIIEYLTKGTKK